jgi:hypothetical protein
LLVATREPVLYDAGDLRRRLATEPLKSGVLAAWGANGLEDFLGHYVGDTAVTRVMQNLEAWPLNTDDRTLIEFAFARSVSTATGFQLVNFKSAIHAVHHDRPKVHGEVDWDGVEETRLGTKLAEQTRNSLTRDQYNRAAALACYLKDDLANALHFWRMQHGEPKTLLQLELVAESFAVKGNATAINYIDQLAAIRPAEAEAIWAELYWKQNRTQEAAASLKRFFQAAREDPWPNRAVLKRALTLAEEMAKSDSSQATARWLYDSLSSPFCVWNAEAEREVTLLSIAMLLDGKNLGQHTARVIETFEPNVFWKIDFLQARKASYEAIHSPRAGQAARDVDRFLNNESLTTDTTALTKEIAIGTGQKTPEANSGQEASTRSSPPADFPREP